MFKLSESEYAKLREESFNNLSKMINYKDCQRTLFDDIQIWIMVKIEKHNMSYNDAVKYLIAKMFWKDFAPEYHYNMTHTPVVQVAYKFNDIVKYYVKIFNEYETAIVKNKI